MGTMFRYAIAVVIQSIGMASRANTTIQKTYPGQMAHIHTMVASVSATETLS